MKKSVSDKKGTNMLLAAFMIFVLPIILIFIGAFIGEYIGHTINASITISQIAGGIAGFVLAGVIIKFFDKNSKADEKAEKIYWDDL